MRSFYIARDLNHQHQAFACSNNQYKNASKIRERKKQNTMNKELRRGDISCKIMKQPALAYCPGILGSV